MQYRHGDIQLIRIKEIPASATKIEGKTLAEGEVTGHAHRIDVGQLFRTKDGELFLQVDELTKVTHEEHKTIALPPGKFRVVQKRQYTPAGWERVQD